MRLGLVLTAAVLAISAASADPLAEGLAGKLQCYRPDPVKKTCGALSAYSQRRDGAILNSADVMLSPNPVVVMHTLSTVEIKGDAVCGPLRKADIDTATILVNGKELPEEQAVGARAQIATAFQAMLGKEVCTTYVPDGDKLSAKVSVDGTPNPAFTQTVIWVSPADGYKVGP
jgi:hypothetical protein